MWALLKMPRADAETRKRGKNKKPAVVGAVLQGVVAKVGPLSGADVVAGLRRLGFERTAQRGSHVKLASILRQAQATIEQLTGVRR
jgi:hypothetical protein